MLLGLVLSMMLDSRRSLRRMSSIAGAGTNTVDGSRSSRIWSALVTGIMGRYWGRLSTRPE
jgi:hypothetical protein